MRVGFIGLGNIGGAIAGNLARDGFALCVCDLDPARCAAAVAAGAHRAEEPGEVAARSDVTFLSLPTPDAVDAVAAAWLRSASSGSVLVDLSTNSPQRVRELGARLAAAGAHLLEAPLSGGVPGAQARMLMFMVGGEAAVYERVRPLLDAIGRASFHLGELGAGNTAKLVNSLVAFSTTVASLEALALAAKAGLDLRTTVEVIRTGGAGNFYTNAAVEGIERRSREPQFALALAAKDADLILELARAHGVPCLIAAQLADLLHTAVKDGMGHRDWTDLPEWFERRGGLAFALAPAREDDSA